MTQLFKACYFIGFMLPKSDNSHLEPTKDPIAPQIQLNPLQNPQLHRTLAQHRLLLGLKHQN